MSQAKRTALILDDEESIRYVLARQLEQLGYECVDVASGQEALEKAACQKFDLMMCDMRMPGMSGLQVVRLFRLDHPETCVVMLTAAVDAAIAVASMRAGADEYIIKPYHLDELTTRLRRAHERRDLAQQSVYSQVDLDEITRDLASQAALFERSNEPWSRYEP